MDSWFPVFTRGNIPEGSMYPNSIYFDLKVVPIKVLWGQSIYYVGTWTIRDRLVSTGSVRALQGYRGPQLIRLAF